jgi:protein-S-isoprenylcysteine O-methyltransferase Ste14
VLHTHGVGSSSLPHPTIGCSDFTLYTLHIPIPDFTKPDQFRTATSLMKYIFEIIWISWLISEILLNRLVRSKNVSSKEIDKNSLNLIWIAIIFSMTSGVLIAVYWNVPVIKTNLLLYVGSTLIVAGMLIRFIAIRTLGKFFTVNLAVHDDQRLINVGIYKYIRHPSYTGSLLSFAGFSLSLNNWISLLIIFIPILITFINRINIEEKLLLQQFGSAYEDYMKFTKRLIPFIY